MLKFRAPIFISEFSRWLALATLLPIFAACGSGSANPFITSCTLPSDQSGSLNGKWATTAIPLAVHDGDFTSDEISTIQTAAATWNQFFGTTQNLTVINTGTGSSTLVSGMPKPNTSGLCSESIYSNSKFTGEVVLYKDTTWPYTSSTGVIALTSTCPDGAPLSGSEISHTFTMAIMEINYQYFFASGTQQPDLQSIVLHEMGHLLGMNHSCTSTGQANMPSCSNPSLDPDYYAALMYPSFSFDSSGNGQQKRTLETNDQGRAQCLYGSTAM